jgi:hypothetical protein
MEKESKPTVGVAELFDLAQCDASSSYKSCYLAVLYPDIHLGQILLGRTAKWGSGGSGPEA